MDFDALLLTWDDLRQLGTFDNAGRWYPRPEIADYFRGYRKPSRAWPNAYAKAAMTRKFARWMVEERPELMKEKIVRAVDKRLGVT